VITRITAGTRQPAKDPEKDDWKIMKNAQIS